MKRVIAVLLCLLFPVAAFAGDANSYKINYDGGSIPGIKAGTNAKQKVLRVEATRSRWCMCLPGVSYAFKNIRFLFCTAFGHDIPLDDIP